MLRLVCDLRYFLLASLLAEVLEKIAFMVGDLVCDVTSQRAFQSNPSAWRMVVARQPVLITKGQVCLSSCQVLLPWTMFLCKLAVATD